MTKGKPEVTNFINYSTRSEQEVLTVLNAVEAKSEHPLAAAIVDYCKTRISSIDLQAPVESFQAIPGHGVEAVVLGQTYYIGNRRLMELKKVQAFSFMDLERLEEDGKTAMMIASKDQVLGIIAVADQVKESTVEVVKKLQDKGIDVYMITGDNKRTANAIAKQIGITNVLAEVLPQNKAEEVKKLQDLGKVVAMVGDGINDSPALVQSDLGIAMASGADIALESGGIIIMNNDLNGVLTAIKLSEETVDKIRQNMFFALFYNILGIPVAARVFAGIGLILKPELAGLAMALSSVSVVSNSLILKRFNPKGWNLLSKLAPAVMTAAFLFVFWQFATISTKENMGVVKTYAQTQAGIRTLISQLLTSGESKAIVNEMGQAKLFLSTESVNTNIKVAEGSLDMSGTVPGVVIGAKEAEIMIEEKLFGKVGDEIENFFGVPKVRVVGILAPTNTLLDEYHLLSKEAFSKVAASDLVVTQTAFGDLKLFYILDGNNTPDSLKGLVDSYKLSYDVDGKVFLPVYIGYDEASEMKKEKLFSNNLDKVENLFGSNVIVAGVGKKNFTTLDMMHFVPKQFKVNYLTMAQERTK